jgi:putative PIN family toxin of toxin-antitoxin system
MRTLLDVNILVSAGSSSDGLPARVLEHASTIPHEVIASREMIKRVDSVLQRRYFALRMSDQRRLKYVARLGSTMTFLDPDPSVTGVADDAEDDQVLGTAVAGRADIIVTGDKGMLAIGNFVGIPIVTARTFLDLIDN